jgi:hypothetical protein
VSKHRTGVNSSNSRSILNFERRALVLGSYMEIGYKCFAH